MMGLVTLTTDFGTRDSYVAQLKGVLLSGCEELRVLDLTHEIAPQDRVEAAIFLRGAVPTFPPGSVHLAVVDPHVGSERRAVAVAIAGQFVVCPDNGLLTLLARAHPIEEARELTNPALRREPVSATFHGRDVFAPAAAHLACGGAFGEIGPAAGGLVELALPEPRGEDGGTVTGEVIHIDRFGNAVTNIPRTGLPEGAAQLRVGGRRLPLRRTYADVASGEPLALIGSGDLVEVAVRDGDAAAALGIARGDRIELEPD